MLETILHGGGRWGRLYFSGLQVDIGFYSLLVILAAALYAVGRAWGRGWVAIAVGILAAVPAVLFASYYLRLLDNAAWFYNLRALPYVELAGAGAGLLAGVVQGRVAVPVGALLLILVPHLKPLLTPLDLSRLRDRCEGEVCLQSTPSTCGPASAATLLRRLGMAATERELAVEARSSASGTEIWYLARALRARGVDAVAMMAPGEIVAPSIAGVLLRGNAGHFIAVLKQSPTEVTVMDPMHGMAVIPRAELAQRYRFTGFFLLAQRWRVAEERR